MKLKNAYTNLLQYQICIVIHIPIIASLLYLTVVQRCRFRVRIIRDESYAIYRTQFRPSCLDTKNLNTEKSSNTLPVPGIVEPN